MNILFSVIGILLTVLSFRIDAQNRKRDRMEALENEKRQAQKEAADIRRQEESERARALHEKEIQEQRVHEDEERRIQWTIQAYQNLYLNSLVKIENYGTPEDIKKAFGKPKDFAGDWKKEVKNKTDYKAFRQYVDQIEVFAKGIYLHNLYNLDTFLKLADPYFNLFCKKRILAFFDSTIMGDMAYENCRRLMADTERYHNQNGSRNGSEVGEEATPS